MRNGRTLAAALIALIASAATVSAEAMAAPRGQQGAQTGVRFARVHRVCPKPKPGRATCLALSLVPAATDSTGASPYTTAAGAVSTGPAGGLTPADLAGAYGYPPSGGAGQIVAIVDAFD